MKNIYMYEKRLPIAIDIMEIMKHTYIENKIWVYTKNINWDINWKYDVKNI